MKTEQLLAILALPVLGYVIWRLSKWRDKMMLDDGFSTGFKQPSPVAWIDRKLRETRFHHSSGEFDAGQYATVIAGIVQTEALAGSWRNGTEKKDATRVRKILAASTANPSLASMGMLEESDIESVVLSSDLFLDYLVSAYAESKRVFSISSIAALTSLQKEIATRFETVLHEYKRNVASNDAGLILREQFLFLQCCFFFASIAETRNSGQSEFEFTMPHMGTQLADRARALDMAIIKNLNRLSSSSESEIGVIIDELLDAIS